MSEQSIVAVVGLWGCPPEEVAPSVIRRVLVRHNYDTNSFNDIWQGIPSDGCMREFPKVWEPGDEPYYPVNNPTSAVLYAKYLSELTALNSRLSTSNARPVVVGRLGAYRYCDMDQAVADALAVDVEQ